MGSTAIQGQIDLSEGRIEVGANGALGTALIDGPITGTGVIAWVGAQNAKSIMLTNAVDPSGGKLTFQGPASTCQFNITSLGPSAEGELVISPSTTLAAATLGLENGHTLTVTGKLLCGALSIPYYVSTSPSVTIDTTAGSIVTFTNGLAPPDPNLTDRTVTIGGSGEVAMGSMLGGGTSKDTLIIDNGATLKELAGFAKGVNGVITVNIGGKVVDANGKPITNP